MLVSQTALTL